MLQRKKMLCVVLLFGLAGYASATNTAWTGTVNTDWFNAGNWDTGNVPASTDTTFVDSFGGSVIINTPGAQTGSLTIANGLGHTATVVLDSGSTLSVTGELVVSYFGDGTLINNGGILNVTADAIYLGFNAPNVRGTIIMNSGTINSEHQMQVGRIGTGFLEMNGGLVNIADDAYGFEIGKNSSAVGHVDLRGGQIVAGNFFMQRSGGTGTMDITGGLMRIKGNVTAKIAAGIAGTQGTITAYGGAGTVMYDFGVTNVGETTVWAVPEPASLILMGIGGVIGLLRKRRKQ